MHFCAAQHVLVCALRKLILLQSKTPLALLTLILHLTTKTLDAKKDHLQLNQKNSPCLINFYLALDNKTPGCRQGRQLKAKAKNSPCLINSYLALDNKILGCRQGQQLKAKKLPSINPYLVLDNKTPGCWQGWQLKAKAKNSPCLINFYLALDNKILGCGERWQLSCRAHRDPRGGSTDPSPQSQHAVLRVDGTQALGHAAVGMLEAHSDLFHCLRLQVGLHLPAERCTLNGRSSPSPNRWVTQYAMG